VVRFRHLALIMLTLGFGLLLLEAANSASALTGGADGLQGFRVPGVLGFKFDMFGKTAYALFAGAAFCLLSGGAKDHSFAVRPRPARHPRERDPHAAIGAPSLSHLRKAYTMAAVMAGLAGAALTHTTSTYRSTCSPSGARPTCSSS